MDATKTLSALNDEMIFNLADNEAEDMLIQLTGPFVGTVQLQVSADGVTYNQVQVVPVDGTAATLNMTVVGTFRRDALAGKFAKLKCTAFTSGPILATVRTMRWV